MSGNQVGACAIIAVQMLLGTAVACEQEQGVAYRDQAARDYKAGHLDAAIAQLKEAVRVCPENAFYAFMLGNALYRAGRLTEAVGQYRASSERNPEFLEDWMSLGFSAYESGDVRGAVDSWRTAVRMAGYSAFAHAALAVGLYQMQDFDGAVLHWKAASTIDARYARPAELSIDIRWKAAALNALAEIIRLSESREIH